MTDVYGFNKTREEKEKWLTHFFDNYPLNKAINLADKSDAEIQCLYYQYQAHCSIHNIKLIPTTMNDSRIKELRKAFQKDCCHSADFGGNPDHEFMFKKTPAYVFQWIVDNVIKAKEEENKPIYPPHYREGICGDDEG